MKRKLVQISAFAEEDSMSDGLYGLADDGSVWYITPFRGESWQRLPDIPQDEETP
jgi:hypothetical protein